MVLEKECPQLVEGKYWQVEEKKAGKGFLHRSSERFFYFIPGKVLND